MIVNYINSSYSKNGWAKIKDEIGAFAAIINDPNRSDSERIDAEGYLAICKFKIAGHLHGLSEQDRAAEIKTLVPILKDHFSLSGEVLFKQIVDHAEEYARDLMSRPKSDPSLAAEESRLCQASAVVMQMPRVGGSCIDFKEVAQTHFKAAQQCAELGSSRGNVFLATAYEWLQNPAIPYRDSVQDLVLNGEQDFNKFCADQVLDAKKQAVELGSKYEMGALGKIAKKEGNIEAAESYLKEAADHGFSKYQYELGCLYREQGKHTLEQQYFSMAVSNDFDVAGEDLKRQPKPDHQESQVKVKLSVREADSLAIRPPSGGSIQTKQTDRKI